ncbi:MAG: glycosyltransferase [Oscillospiraceae bacterium]|jgi:dolichyl-phosphate beta-glucosyltransferase|nr:glycosyltransferase [Oscillospiraceae bacterium]
MTISLIIPAYNEERGIAQTAVAAREWLALHFPGSELILINDGSADRTAQLLSPLAGGQMRLISYGQNRGKGYAIRQGVLAAQGDFIFYTDADLAYGLDIIAAAIELFEQTGADMILGSRRLTPDGYGKYTGLRSAASRCFALGMRILLGLAYDSQCGFKGFKLSAARDIFSRCETDRFAFDAEVLLLAQRLGLRAAEIPVKILRHTSSSVSLLRDSAAMVREVFAIRRRIRRLDA